MKVSPTEIKDKDQNYVSRFCYWQALLGPRLLGDYRVLERFN